MVRWFTVRPKLRMSGAASPLSLCAFKACRATTFPLLDIEWAVYHLAIYIYIYMYVCKPTRYTAFYDSVYS